MKITFIVPGLPQTAGSKRGFIARSKTGKPRVIIVDDNPKSGDWKSAVASHAYAVRPLRPIACAVRVRFVFYLPRPKGHFSGKSLVVTKPNAPEFHITRPDVLKLARAAEDAMTGIVYADDSQIVDEFLFKRYGWPARVEIVIQTKEPKPKGIKPCSSSHASQASESSSRQLGQP